MITSNSSFDSYAKALVHEPVYYLTITGTSGVFSTRALGSYSPWLYGLDSISQKVVPEEGKSTLSGFDFSLLDVAGKITSLVRTDKNLQDNAVSVYMGFNGLATASFLPVFTGRIANIEPDKGGFAPGYRFQCEDIQRTLVTTLFDNATASNQAVVTGNPMDLLLATLISTSTGATSTYDFLTGGGFSIDPANIDVAGIEQVRDNWFDGWTFRFRFKKGLDNAKTWVEQQILRPCACHLKVLGNGQLSVAYLGTSVPTANAPSLTVSNCKVKDYSLNWKSMVNKINLYYDYSETAGKFYTHQWNVDATSRANRGTTKTIKYEFKGIHGATSPEGDYDGDALITTIATRILDRFANPRPTAKTDVFLKGSGQLAEVGDKIMLTHAHLPNPITGVRGITAAIWEVHDKKWDLNNGQCTLDLENAGADYHRYSAFAPYTEISGSATSTLLPVKDATGFTANDVIEVFCTGSAWPTAAISYVAGNNIYLKTALSKVPLKDAPVQYATYNDVITAQKHYPFIADTGATHTITAGSTTTSIVMETGSSLHYNTWVKVTEASGDHYTEINSVASATLSVNALPLAPADEDTLTPLVFSDGEGAYLIG